MVTIKDALPWSSLRLNLAARSSEMAASLVKLAYLELLGGLLMRQPMAGFVAFALTLCLAPTALYADQLQPSAEGAVDASGSTPAISSDDMSSTSEELEATGNSSPEPWEGSDGAFDSVPDSDGLNSDPADGGSLSKLSGSQSSEVFSISSSEGTWGISGAWASDGCRELRRLLSGVRCA